MSFAETGVPSLRALPKSQLRSQFARTLGMGLALWLAMGTRVPAQPPAKSIDKPARSSKEFGRKQNHLAREASPYLRQHAENPVEWYPWGPEALQRALQENKPIFLSIGYSTCFWCHVMQRQVFENAEIAAYMNQHFINIKVDREERPDLDDIYMTALQVYFQLAKSSQGGGWPMSLFLTPDARPIAGGTYFPPEDMPGQTGFPKVLRQIHQAWTTRETDVRNTADLISREVARLATPPLDPVQHKLTTDLVTAALKAVEDAYDPAEGGVDFDPQAPEGPKFPSPCRLALLQSQVGRPPAPGTIDPTQMLDNTLSRMAAGGIWDHLGGGFHRYSVDRRWQKPHFEKMLYDNAQLAEIYVEAYRRTGRDQYRQIAEEIFDFVKRDLTGPHGEFYSALDAETDGVEGAYYLWTPAELQKILSAGNLRIFLAVYGSDQSQSPDTGMVLRLNRSLPEIAEELSTPQAELQLRLAEMRQQLLQIRNQRPVLRKDDLVLTAWNGMMIRAFARGGQILKRQDYLEAASKAAIYLLAEHRDPNGGLLRTDVAPPDQQPAFLDDYSCLISGLLALYDATREDKWLNASRRLMDDQISSFWDQQRGGFYFTSHSQEIVLARMKSAADNVVPSGNSLSAQNLVRLSRWRTDEVYRSYAEKTLAAFSRQLKEEPERSPYLALALQEYLHWYGAPETRSAGDGLFAGGLSNPAAAGRPAVAPAIPFPDQPPVVVSLRQQTANGNSPAHVQARGMLNVASLPRGGTCRVAVEIVIEPEWHLNANPAQPDYLLPTTLKLTAPAGVTLERLQYPAGSPFRVAGIDDALSVYERHVVIQGVLQIPEDVDDAIDLQLELNVQLCNSRSCLAPGRLILAGKIPVAPTGQEVQFTNEVVFASPGAALPRPVPREPLQPKATP